MKKKRRPFQQKWLYEYSWLRYDDGTMFCAICRQEPVADKSSTLVIGVTGEFRRETPLSSFDSTLSESTENQEPSIIDSSYSEDDFSKDFD
uniref:TTF-type domain-containing protein n=1 Tax=Amphimedon queenslandica TaxID=400682 RepID=A0A1X7UC50_AMPQE